MADLTPAETAALADCARAWLQLGDEPTLRSALDKLTAEPDLDADTYPGDYPLDHCQPGDPTPTQPA